MKQLYVIINAIFFLYSFSLFSQKQVSIENPLDSIKLKNSPYYFVDENRPYKINPEKWIDFPNQINTIEAADSAISQAKLNNDAYRVFQISSLELFKDDKSRISAFYFVEQYGYLYQDPFILYYLAVYLQKNPIVGHDELNPKYLINATYKISASRKEASLLRKIAKLQTEFNYLDGISFDEINRKANAIDGSIAPNYTQCKNTMAIKHEGMLISGDITNGKGVKVYTENDEFVRKGWRYEGEFIDGFESFQGNLFDEEDNAVYIGQWDKGLFAGAGKFNNVDGTYYLGLFLDGKCHGKGDLYDLDGKIIYSGNFDQGKITGKGKRFYKNGDVYEGDFVDGKRHGKGVYTFKNKTSYEGDFVDNKRHGKGKFRDARKLVFYDGDFIDDEQTGFAISYDLTDGSRYEGNHAKGLKNGKILHVLKDGRQRYETWENGKQIIDSREEQAFLKTTIENQNKKEKCPSKISGENYSIEFLGSPEQKELNENTTVYYFSNEKFVYSFSETRSANYKHLGVEDSKAILEKAMNSNGGKIIKDVVFVSDKGGMWCRHLISEKDGKGEGQLMFIDTQKGKIYHLRITNRLTLSIDRELELFKNQFIYGLK